MEFVVPFLLRDVGNVVGFSKRSLRIARRAAETFLNNCFGDGAVFSLNALQVISLVSSGLEVDAHALPRY